MKVCPTKTKLHLSHPCTIVTIWSDVFSTLEAWRTVLCRASPMRKQVRSHRYLQSGTMTQSIRRYSRFWGQHLDWANHAPIGRSKEIYHLWHLRHKVTNGILSTRKVVVRLKICSREETELASRGTVDSKLCAQGCFKKNLPDGSRNPWGYFNLSTNNVVQWESYESSKSVRKAN